MSKLKAINTTDLFAYCKDVNGAKKRVAELGQTVDLNVEGLSDSFYQCMSLSMHAPDDMTLSPESSEWLKGHNAENEVSKLSKILVNMPSSPAKNELMFLFMKYRGLYWGLTGEQVKKIGIP